MIRDSSYEEDDDEQEEEEEPIDFAAEAAKTAARSLARSASSSYLKALFPKCQEAVGDAEIQAKQLEALDELVAKHPVSPKRQAQVRKVKSAAGDGESMDQGNQAQSMRAFTEMNSGETKEVTGELRKASPKNTWSTGLKAASSTGRFETTMRSAPKANSASLTQLPSGTWRGPVETSGNEREMFLRSLSKHESMPLLTFRPRRGKDLWVTNVSNPAPGTYPDLDESHTSKYLAPRQVSFGFSRKSSRWPANADQKPGPGAHSVVSFERFKYADPVRHSFGAAPRGRPNPIRQSGPGPGAYGIQRSADEEGPAVTMVGKYRKRGVLNYDEPGPGAYEPTMVLCGPSAPSVGFATSLRQDFYPKEDKGIPAPGTYDVMKQNPVGSDCLAFSMAGKRKRHDLTAHLYAGPGPGFYNHGSTFGYRSTWQAPAPPLPWAPPLANGATK